MIDRKPVLDEEIEVACGLRQGHTARCRLRVFEGFDGRQVAVATQLGEGYAGPSVTNAAEYIWLGVARRLGTEDYTLIEHYGLESYPVPNEDAMGYDVVTLTAAGQPRWQPISVQAVRDLLKGVD